MTILERIFIAEDKTKLWIETNRIKWYLFLVCLGASLGIGESLLLNSFSENGLIFASVYSSLLVACEFALGGEGIRG